MNIIVWKLYSIINVHNIFLHFRIVDTLSLQFQNQIREWNRTDLLSLYNMGASILSSCRLIFIKVFIKDYTDARNGPRNDKLNRM